MLTSRKVHDAIHGLIVLVLQGRDDVLQTGFEDQDYVRLAIYLFDRINQQDIGKRAYLQKYFRTDFLAAS